MNWVYLTIAPDQITAEIWVDLLREQGVAAMIRPSDAVSFLGVTSMGTRLMVAEDDLERARELLADEGAPDP